MTATVLPRTQNTQNHFITDYPTKTLMIKDFTPRLYQETIFATCAEKNTLVVLPTGLGKTSIGLMLAFNRLKNYPDSKIVFLAPTKPLVDQHRETFSKKLTLEQEEFIVFTGGIAPDKRKKMWKDAKIVFCTPQTMENDIISGRVDLKEISLIVFDEAHRAVGDYAYVFIADQYNKRARHPKLLGLTASPGSDMEKIKEVCNNLHVEDVEVRTSTDHDVKPYVQEVKMDWVKVELPSALQSIQKDLNKCYTNKIAEIKKHGCLDNSKQLYNKIDVLKFTAQMQREISRGNRDVNVLKSISLAAEAMKVSHAQELLETQGVSMLISYMDKLTGEAAQSKSKAAQNLVVDTDYRNAALRARSLEGIGIEHPKLAKLKEIIKKEIKNEGKLILFTQFRDTASKIHSELEKFENAKPVVFVGQAKKGTTGLSQKEQKRIIEQFREGDYNILIATSVAEEGLDIPKVDTVIFYEAIPSVIRHIQRRGRTGRLEKGKVMILTTKGTRDEAYKWVAIRKEKKMYDILLELKRSFVLQNNRQEENLQKYFAPELDVKIVCDDRERSSAVIKKLADLGMQISTKRLQIGDYALSDRCVVEYKKTSDFVDSIVDGRLLSQIRELKRNYDRPIIIIEGEEDIYNQRNIHHNAIRGMLATITVSYGIPILQTRSPIDTANMMAVIAKREQENNEKKEFSLHGSKKPLSVKEQQEYVISALPGVGPKLVKPLLEKFGSIKGVVNASEEDMAEKIGKKKAKDIQTLLDEKYY